MSRFVIFFLLLLGAIATIQGEQPSVALVLYVKLSRVMSGRALRCPVCFRICKNIRIDSVAESRALGLSAATIILPNLMT
jgi:hypothetical protein